MRELYKPKPEREILHARKFALEPAVVASFDLSEEHIVAKAQRLMDAIIRLGNGLASLGKVAGLDIPVEDWVGIDYHKVRAEGMSFYPVFCRLAQVAPLNMEQHAFLARCKTISEIISSIPDGNLKSLLERAGCKKTALKGRKTFKLLETLMNITSDLNERHEKPEAIVSESEPEEWDRCNQNMAPLFQNNDLRIADAHENPQECSAILIKMGFDTAGLKDGYGRALDFVMERVIATINDIAVQIENLLEKG